MLVVEKSLVLAETVHQMGFHSVEDFALLKVKEDLLKQLTDSYTQTEVFEKKYETDYAGFCKNFHHLSNPLFEREEDSAEWSAELQLQTLLQKRLSRLSA